MDLEGRHAPGERMGDFSAERQAKPAGRATHYLRFGHRESQGAEAQRIDFAFQRPLQHQPGGVVIGTDILENGPDQGDGL